MSKIRTAATAAACAIGITAGAIAMASPAAATGTGDGIYDCHLGTPDSTPDYDNVDVSFERDSSGNLTLFTSLTSPLAPVSIVGSTYEGGVLKESGINGSVSNTTDPVVLTKSGSTASYTSSPDEIRLVITPPGTTVRCIAVSYTGFPL